MLLIFVFFLSSLRIAADGLEITGYAGGNQDSEVLLYRYSDPVSQNEEFVASAWPDSKGRFIINVENSGITHYFIRNGTHDNHFFAGDSSMIDIVCYPYEPLADKAVTNPFFLFERVNIADRRNCSLNNLVLLLEEQYEKSIIRRYDKSVTGKEVPEFQTMLQLSDCQELPDRTYAALWARFREASLRVAHIADLRFRRETFREYAPLFDPRNDAATQLAGVIYSGYISELADKNHGGIVTRVMEEGENPALLLKLVIEETGLNMLVAQYILLDNLYHEFFDSRFNRGNIAAVTEWFRDNGEGEEIRRIASSLYTHMGAVLPGGRLAGFVLKGDDGESYSPASFRGKYMLMIFIDTRSPFACHELTLLKNSIDPYMSYIEIVTIVCDPDFEKGQSVLKARGIDWLMLDASGEYELQSVYKTRPLPRFVLAGPDSEVVSNPAPWPSENLIKLIGSILQPNLLDDISNRTPAFR